MANVYTIHFAKENDLWVCRFLSPGDCLVQIETESAQHLHPLYVGMSLPGMSPMPYDYGIPFSEAQGGVILRLNIPKDVIVIIKSGGEVSKAKYMSIS